MAAEDNRAEETYRAFQTRIRTAVTTAATTATTTVTIIPEINKRLRESVLCVMTNGNFEEVDLK